MVAIAYRQRSQIPETTVKWDWFIEIHQATIIHLNIIVMINIKDLRIGNIIKDTVNSTLCTVLEVRENHVRCQYIRADTGETYVSIIHKEALSPIKVTSKIILACSA